MKIESNEHYVNIFKLKVYYFGFEILKLIFEKLNTYENTDINI